MTTYQAPPTNDPSIAELGEQLDAFVAQIQARLAAIADADAHAETDSPSRSQPVTHPRAKEGPIDRLAALKQRLAERLESCNDA